ncbi:MAG: LptF/LptG family permease [Planctomycetota bacterium]
MKILQRYLTRELVLNTAFTFAVLASLIVMLVFSITTLKSGFATLRITTIFQIVGYLCIPRLDVIIPLSIFTATLWTYARARGDGELSAMRGCGVHLYHLFLPAALLGAVGTLALAFLQDEVMPGADYAQRRIGRQYLAESLEAMLAEDNRRIEDSKFICEWAESGKDAEGYRVLRDVVVTELRPSGPVITRAHEAIPRLQVARGQLELELKGFRRSDQLASEMLMVTLDLGALSDRGPPRRKVSHRSYEELLTRSQRDPELEERRENLAELHRRAATAFSVFLFALLGAPLGVVLRQSNRALCFGIGFLIVLILGYAPMFMGMGLARSGTLPVWLALWIGNSLIAIATLFTLGRALRG